MGFASSEAGEKPFRVVHADDHAAIVEGRAHACRSGRCAAARWRYDEQLTEMSCDHSGGGAAYASNSG